MISPLPTDTFHSSFLRVRPRPSLANGGLSQERFAGISFKGKEANLLDWPRPLPSGSIAVRPQHESSGNAGDEGALEQDAQNFLNLVFSGTGIDISAYRSLPLARRLPACLRALRVKSIAEAHEEVERNPEKKRVAIDSLLIGTTEFFRDPEVFQQIREKVLPSFTGKAPRVWSVACSDGSELYSMALLLEQAGLLGNNSLLGSDCRATAITHARQGIYPSAALSSIPQEFHSRFVKVSSSGIRIDNAIRDSVSWTIADVLKPQENPGWDLIFCRNFSIYLDSISGVSLWESLEKSLLPGGFLIVGKTERPRARTLTRVGDSIYQKNQS